MLDPALLERLANHCGIDLVGEEERLAALATAEEEAAELVEAELARAQAASAAKGKKKKALPAPKKNKKPKKKDGTLPACVERGRCFYSRN